MTVYNAPVEDMQFVLHDVLDFHELRELPGFEEVSRDISDAVLEEVAKICETVLLPINRSGDEEGCHYENGVVRTPKGFKDAYDEFARGGWTGLACDTEFGGQGLPDTLNVMVQEMLCSSNLSFSIYLGLSHGAYNALMLHASDEIKATYVPKLVSGQWSGTMCLTEPQCGTDLGLVRTKAEPLQDGSYQISGQKIFISAGEHDLTENIIHLVLARTPDAPEGIKGISLFLVPKFLLKDDGTPGKRNGVMCGAIEHKMGINGSSTCVMNFDEATGYLLGDLHKGMRAMFTMMNAARLAVGVQGIGVAEAAYQGAVAYARERLQGRAPSGDKHPDKAADPLLVHPDIRRMLLTMRAYAEGARALAGWIGKHLDIAARHPDPLEREAAEEFVALMTPVAKSFFTDAGSECANLGVQVLGGHGYIRDQGMEQLIRDARITQIYEGTNGIQALDLVGRKLAARMGRNLRRFFHPVDDYLEAHAQDVELAELVLPLAKAFGRLQRATGWIAQKGLKNADEAAGAASDYLRLFGLVAVGFMWVRMAEIASKQLRQESFTNGFDRRFYQTKLDVARFFIQRMLPQSGALFAAIMSGADNLMAVDESDF